jgi:hypothetical protein
VELGPPATAVTAAAPTEDRADDAGVPEQPPETEMRYADGESDLRFDWGALADSLALMLSYAWLLCGGLLLIAVPLLFVALWLRSRRSAEPEEDE